MSLPFEYFLNNEHITDLQKFKDEKLYFIIHEFYKELENLEKIKNIQLKYLKILCDQTTQIINDIKIILNSYKDVYYEEMNNQNNRKRESINDIIYEIKKIELFIKDLKTLKINSRKVKKLTNDILIFIRLLSYTINELTNN